MGLGSSTPEGRLSENDLRLVDDSWKAVMENPEDNGVAIFKTFLERHNYYFMFKKFEGIPRDELVDNKFFRSHSLSIMRSVNNIVRNANDEEKLRSLLVALGRQHNASHVTPTQFQELKLVILDVLKTAFDLSDEVLTAWNKTLDIAFVFIFQGLVDEGV